ncbi:MAG: hypothetical protein ACM30G_05030 [Micromonosporaceae bacterium]
MSVGSVTFPTTPLSFRVLIALGADLTASWLTWSWVDITEFVRFVDGISTRTGRPDESSVVTPGRTTLTLENRDGRFSRRNPTGPYYGLLSKNTPIWVQVDAGSGFRTRVQHYVNDWPTRWDKSGNDCTVTIVASGVLRRAGQGVSAGSALRQAVSAAGPVVYLPLEEGSSATRFASGLVGGDSAPFVGAPDLASVSDFDGSLPVPDFVATANTAGAGFASVAVPAATAGFVSLSFVVKGSMASSPNPTMFNALRLDFVTGGLTTVTAVAYAGYTAGAFTSTVGIDILGLGAGAVTTFGTGFNPFDGDPHDIVLRLTQSGSGIATELWADGVQVDTGTLASTTLGIVGLLAGPVPAAGALDAITVNNTGASIALGHVALFADSSAMAGGDYHDAAIGYAGEMAHERIERMCSVAGIAYASTGATARSQQLGPQPIGTPLQVIRDAEAVDRGVLFEADFGLGYQGKQQRYNAPVLLALDFDQSHIAEAPQPADDDQRTRNRFTASRTDGSEATVEDADSIAAEGLYDDSLTVNTYTDEQLANYAGWRVHEGTVDEDRWPAVAVNLTGVPTLIDPWTALPFGARMTAANPPDGVAPDTIDAFIEGYAERFDPYSWRAAVTTTPATINEVYQVEGSGNRGRVDAGASTLAADVSDVATSLSVASTGAIWVQGAVSFDIFVAGERMTVTNISGASSPQTFTVTRSVNGVVKTQNTGAAVRLWRPGAVAL